MPLSDFVSVDKGGSNMRQKVQWYIQERLLLPKGNLPSNISGCQWLNILRYCHLNAKRKIYRQYNKSLQESNGFELWPGSTLQPC